MKQILLVDDNTSLRALIADLLRARAYQVHEARDGQDGLKLIENESFDVIIADLLLPGRLNGIELLARHNRLSPGKERILLTAFPSPQLPKICQFIHARFVPKPTSLNNLIHAIEGHPDATFE
jgi:CheY-like chemotaxis protein